MDRDVAVERVLTLLETIENEPMPVPLREVWVLGDLALGMDPVERLDIYLSKDLLFTTQRTNPDEAKQFKEQYGIDGIGTTVSAEWATEFPEFIRANASGHAAPERCLGSHLVAANEPMHLEVCNASFEQNVTQRLRGAKATKSWEELLDPRAVCLWKDGQRSQEAPTRLREGSYVFPTLPDALAMLGLSDEDAAEASRVLQDWRSEPTGRTVRGDVI